MMVSIIVPAYNCETTIESCILSALQQTYCDINVVMIDDGSTDRTLATAKKIQERDPRLTIISRENHGIAYTRNEGLKLVKGEYICFLDSDDLMKPNMVEKLMTGADLSIAGYEIKQNNGNGLSSAYKRVTAEGKLYYSSNEVGEVMSRETKLLYPLWNKMFRTELIRKYNITFPNINCWEDACFICRYLAHSSSVSIITEPLYQYLIDNTKESLSKMKYVTDQKKQYFYIFQEFKQTAVHLNAPSHVLHDNCIRLMRNIIGDMIMNLPGNISIAKQREYLKSIKQTVRANYIPLNAVGLKEIADLLSKIGYLLYWYCPIVIAPYGYTLLSRSYRFVKRLRGLK